MKKFLVAALVVLVAVVGLAVYAGWELIAIYRATSPGTAAGDLAKQDDSRIEIPPQQPLERRPPNPLKNVYWGELHVHTVESLDAVLFGTTRTVEDAYRFARGEKFASPGGEQMQLARPLDFVAITDHAEGFGLRTRCDDDGLALVESLTCWLMETPNAVTFQVMRGGRREAAADAGPKPPAGVYQNKERARRRRAFPICEPEHGGDARCLADARADWARYIALANRYNEPGVFTTFAAYEFSPTLDDGGKHHRNVIFHGTQLPEHAISAMDVDNALDLWRGLEATCTGDCDFITIPHNMNKGWGLFYSRHTYDGGTYGADDWRLRMRRERLAEMYQVKGASECALGVGATDEECAFGQVLKPCEPGQETGCAFETSFARQGLKIGLQLGREFGFNPLAFGMVAATDMHNSNPGDAEEWDYVGKVGSISSPAVRRLNNVGGRPAYHAVLTSHTSGGLAAVWAEENTRAAIFAGMKRREAYATSGPRMTLRFFAGFGFDETIVAADDPIAVATEGGVPMGDVLRPDADAVQSPTFFVWAGADPLSAPLQRVQIVKGWIDAGGETHESVRDVVCAGGLEVNPATGRCPDNGAHVQLETCKISSGSGAGELMAAWRDAGYDPTQGAFYYVRAIQNPTCRWSTYDAIRLGTAPSPDVPATIRERAWSSPIWIDSAE